MPDRDLHEERMDCYQFGTVPTPDKVSSVSEAMPPCPFCGHEDVEPDCFSRNKDNVCDEPAVNCNGCGVTVIFDFEAEQPWAEIKRRWAMRSSAPRTAQEK